MKKAFISYVKEDSDKASKLCQALEEAGIDFWLDKNDIQPGSFWKESINTAIRNGAYFIACFSEESEAKCESYMREELLVAIDLLRKKPIDQPWFIPVKFSNCIIPAYEISAEKTLRDIQFVELHDDVFQTNIRRIISLIGRTFISSDIALNENGRAFQELRNHLFFTSGTIQIVNEMEKMSPKGKELLRSAMDHLGKAYSLIENLRQKGNI